MISFSPLAKDAAHINWNVCWLNLLILIFWMVIELAENQAVWVTSKDFSLMTILFPPITSNFLFIYLFGSCCFFISSVYELFYLEFVLFRYFNHLKYSLPHKVKNLKIFPRTNEWRQRKKKRNCLNIIIFKLRIKTC